MRPVAVDFLVEVNDIPFFCCFCCWCCGRACFFDCHYVGHGSEGSRHHNHHLLFVLEFFAEFMSGLFYYRATKCCTN